jgi:Site-specific recombinase XerD
MAKTNVVSFPAAKQKPEAKEKRSRRTDGRIQAEYRYTDESGKAKRKVFYGKTFQEADKKRRAFRAEIENGMNPDEKTVAAYADNWLKTYKVNIRPGSYRAYEHDIKLINEHIGGKILKKVTLSDVQEILNTRAGFSASAIKKTKATLKSIFESAKKDRYITFNPCDGLTSPKGTSGSHRALSSDEIAFLRNAAQEHEMYPAAMAMLFGGLRRGEAIAFDVDRDVNFDTMEMNITEAVYFDGNEVLTGDTKTDAGTRTIPIMKPLDDILKQRRGSGLVLRDQKGNVMSLTAFRRKWESYIYTLEVALNGVHRRWANEQQKANWKEIDIRCHDLRHTFATLLYDAGVDVKTAQKWLGHSDPMVTMRIYTHLSESKATGATDLAKKHFENLPVKTPVNESVTT